MAEEPRRRSRGALLLVVGVPLALFALALLVIGSASLLRGLNPFTTRTIDRSQPPLLVSIQNISEYHGAVGNFQVVVDLEHDVSHIPSALAGKRTLFVGAATVDALVDFGGLSADAVKVSADRTSVQITLPQPVLAKPNIDPDRSYVFIQQRGLWDRLKSLLSESDQQPLYQAAADKVATAAAASGLAKQAADNTRAMLTGLLHSLGYQATVSFVAT
jgi:hypothetical protein